MVKLIDIEITIPEERNILLCEGEITQYNDLFYNEILIKDTSTCFDLNKLSLYLAGCILKVDFIPVYDVKDKNHTDEKADEFRIYISNDHNQKIIGCRLDKFKFKDMDNKTKNDRLILAMCSICHEYGHYIYKTEYKEYYEKNKYDIPYIEFFITFSLTLFISLFFAMIVVIIFKPSALKKYKDEVFYIILFMIISLIIFIILFYCLQNRVREEIFCDMIYIKLFPKIVHYKKNEYWKTSSYFDILDDITSTHPSHTFRAKYHDDPELITYYYPELLKLTNNLKNFKTIV